MTLLREITSFLTEDSQKPYYHLLDRKDASAKWAPQFGSYDRSDCVDEERSMRDSDPDLKKTNTKILKAENDSPAALEAALSRVTFKLG